MLSYPSNARIFIYSLPTDMRKGLDGLTSIVEKLLQEKVTGGVYFVFLNKRRDLMKVLYWDQDGLAIWLKRLEKGSFGRPGTESAYVGRREFLMLLEGVVPKRLNRRYKLS